MDMINTVALPRNTGDIIKFRGNTPAVIFMDEELHMQKPQQQELPSWMQALNEQVEDRRKALARMVMVLADKFNGDEWEVASYSGQGIHIKHLTTGVMINAGTTTAVINLACASALNVSVHMTGQGTQMNLVAGAINYLCINVVNHHLDKQLALAEQGEFDFDYIQEEVREEVPTTASAILYNQEVARLKRSQLQSYKGLIADDSWR